MSNENKPEDVRKYAEVATSYSDAMSLKKLLLKKKSIETMKDENGSKGS